MNLSSISHTDADVYAISEEEIAVLIKTGKEVTSVSLIHEDPYVGGSMGSLPWSGGASPMRVVWELREHMIWMLRVRPPFRRVQYYFELRADGERMLMYEDGFYTPERARMPGRIPQYFRFPWMNASDLIR